MPYSLITRQSAKTTSIVLPTGETFTATDRVTELLRKLSEQTKRLRGMPMAGTSADLARKGRQDSLEAMVKRGIIPIHVTDGSPTLHANVQCYPSRRGGPETITATPGGAFLGGTTASFVNPNTTDATLGATGVTDFTAVSSLDPQSSPGQPAPTPTVTGAMGAARATID